jgi:hypothetical protein
MTTEKKKLPRGKTTYVFAIFLSLVFISMLYLMIKYPDFQLYMIPALK